MNEHAKPPFPKQKEPMPGRIAYLSEHDDANETKRLVEEAGRKAVLMSGDIGDPAQCRAVIEKAVSELGGLDILVNNAAHQASFKSLEDISDDEWELTFQVNIHAMFYLSGRRLFLRPCPRRRWWSLERTCQ
jgi:NAD(P)-dependent dehydrogenase (short-subunit alcohol dehydrogenase family)